MEKIIQQAIEGLNPFLIGSALGYVKVLAVVAVGRLNPFLIGSALGWKLNQ